MGTNYYARIKERIATMNFWFWVIDNVLCFWVGFLCAYLIF